VRAAAGAAAAAAAAPSDRAHFLTQYKCTSAAHVPHDHTAAVRRMRS